MYQFAQRDDRYARILSPFVTTALLTVPAAQAFAMPADSAAQATSAISWSSFGIGCAVGAAAGGIVVGLVGNASRRSLREELEEVTRIAERAEESARRAEMLLDERSRDSLYGVAEEPSVTGVLERPKRVVVPRVSEQHEADSAAEAHATSEATEASVTQETPAVRATHKSGRGVRAVLQERLGSTAGLGEMPVVIARGTVREEPAPVFAAPAAPVVRREFDPAARALVIDRRIPRFDESLYPDPALDMGHEVDVFETAMQAMEDSLNAEAAERAEQAIAEQAIAEQPTQGFEPVQAEPDIADAESYIDYLIQDEMERNRSGSARRYSRAHLTMFEGTGDLSAARRATHRPRHMQAASKEA